MSKFHQGEYIPKNPQKYIGKGRIIFRSSWEQVFCRFLDTHPSILQWSSESVRIPYVNPLTGKKTTYVPDFFIIYQDKDGVNHAELVEIKPLAQTSMTEAKSRYDKAAVILNSAKWASARAWCSANKITFRVMTQNQLFAGAKK
jgi:hypothetical protein